MKKNGRSLERMSKKNRKNRKKKRVGKMVNIGNAEARVGNKSVKLYKGKQRQKEFKSIKKLHREGQV